MVLGLGKAGLLPARRTRAASGGSPRGASSSSLPASLGGASESQPQAELQQARSPAPAAGAEPSPLVRAIVEASLARLEAQQLAAAQEEEQQQQTAQHPTRSGSSVAANGVAPAGAFAAPVSAEVCDRPQAPSSGQAPSSPMLAAPTPALAAGPAADAPGGGGAPPGPSVPRSQPPTGASKLGQQAALRKKLRAAAAARATPQVSEQGQQQQGGSHKGGSPQSLHAGHLQSSQHPQQDEQDGAQGAEVALAERQQAVAAPEPEAAVPALPVQPEVAPMDAAREGPGEGQRPGGEQSTAGGGRSGKEARTSAAAGGEGRRLQPPPPQQRGQERPATATPKRGRGKKRRVSQANALTPSRTGLIGKVVEVPATLFSVDVPGLYYRGLVTKREGGRRQDAMEVKFLDDGSKYWFPTADIRGWLEEQEARQAQQAQQAQDPAAGIATDRATDEFAAEAVAPLLSWESAARAPDAWRVQVLTDIASGSMRSGCRGGSQLSDAAAGPPAPASETGGTAVGGAREAHASGEEEGEEAACIAEQVRGASDAIAVSSKRRRLEAPAGGEGGGGNGDRGCELGGREGGDEEVDLKARGSSRLAAGLHVMADAAGMNLLSPPSVSLPENGDA